MNDQMFVGLLAELGMLVAERIGSGTFRPVGPVANFWSKLFEPELPDEGAPMRFAASAFLRHFLDEAESFWTRSTSGCLEAGPWQQTDAHDHEYSLSVAAVSLGEKKFLVLSLLGQGFQKRHERLQSCRDMYLEERVKRRAAEYAVQESEEKYRALFEQSLDAIVALSREGEIWETNSAFCSLLGITKEELLASSFHDLWHKPGDRVLFQKEMEEKVRLINFDWSIRCSDGTIRHCLLNASLWEDRAGNTLGYICTIRDITDRERMEEERRRLAAAVEQAHDCVIMADAEGIIFYANPALFEVSGFIPQEAVGRHLGFLMRGELRHAFSTEVWKGLALGQVWVERFENERKDGTRYVEDASISALTDQSGKIVNYLVVKRDVSREASLQRQLTQAQKMEAVATLAGGIAHDFNNLLQVILGYSDLLLMGKAQGDPDRENLEVIQNAARDGAYLVSRILTFSRKAESKVRPIDLNQEIVKTKALLNRTLPRMIETRLVLAEPLQIIDADPAQIEQVLLNLAVNAHHAMPVGGQLVIETSNVSISNEYDRTHLGCKPGKYVLLTVSDTGVGMEPDVLERIFEPFFTTKANGEGTGLGLAVVHGIVSQHGGYIYCYSEPGLGTSFKIYFPVSASAAISEFTLKPGMPAFGTETILLVDDDDRVREMAQKMIQAHGYQVLIARSGEEALEIYAARKDDISLVILDLIMPGMGGKKCLGELLLIDPSVKVLVASGYSSGGLTEDKRESGAKGFVSKPYEAKDILRAIRRVLDRGHL